MIEYQCSPRQVEALREVSEYWGSMVACILGGGDEQKALSFTDQIPMAPSHVRYGATLDEWRAFYIILAEKTLELLTKEKL